MIAATFMRNRFSGSGSTKSRVGTSSTTSIHARFSWSTSVNQIRPRMKTSRLTPRYALPRTDTVTADHITCAGVVHAAAQLYSPPHVRAPPPDPSRIRFPTLTLGDSPSRPRNRADWLGPRARARPPVHARLRGRLPEARHERGRSRARQGSQAGWQARGGAVLPEQQGALLLRRGGQARS